MSHTISGKRPVSSELQQRVRAAMADLGQRPRRAAQSLASGRTRLIGLVVPDIANGYFAELAKSIEDVSINAEYNLVLCNSGFDHEREVLYIEMIQSRAVDGILYAAGAPPTDSELVALLGDVPVVLVDEEVPGFLAPTFVSDNTNGGRLAAEHLLAHGHTSAAVISAGDLCSASDRMDGFLQAWQEAGHRVPAVLNGGFTFEGGAAAAAQLIESVAGGDITALFAANDLMALGALKQFTDASLSVPDDVSVVGFDDIAFARLSQPSLTTVRQDVAGIGRQAALTLINALENREPLTQARHVFGVELAERGSSGHIGPRVTDMACSPFPT